jgi:hypothetical protein
MKETAMATAWARKVGPTPIVPITIPAIGGPTTRVMFCPALIRATALVKLSRGTSAGTSDCCVGMSSPNSDPLRNAEIGRCHA